MIKDMPQHWPDHIKNALNQLTADFFRFAVYGMGDNAYIDSYWQMPHGYFCRIVLRDPAGRIDLFIES